MIRIHKLTVAMMAGWTAAAFAQMDPGDCQLGASQQCAATNVDCRTSDGAGGRCKTFQEGCVCVPYNICHRFANGTYEPRVIAGPSIAIHLGHGDCLIDDGVDCTVDRCDRTLGCVSTPDNTLCDDDNECTEDVCDPAIGSCVNRPKPDGFLCDDGIACTDGSFCLDTACVGRTSNCPQGQNECLVATCNYQSGECEGHQVVCPPASDPCFDIVCHGNDGICRSELIGEPRDCEDANACDTNEDCADNDACTVDQCLSEGGAFICHYSFVNGAIFCNDNNPCTVDTCHPATGCENGPLNPIADCGGDDGLACTTQVCDPARGGCAKDLNHSMCDDGLACTLDLCDPNLGCTNTLDPGACGNGVCDLPCGEHAGNCPADCIGTNSCVGPNACTGVTGQIGNNSCNGILACLGSDAIVGDGSCNGGQTCRIKRGTVGENSCNGAGACYFKIGDVGDGSCNHTNACSSHEVGPGAAGNVGDNSCSAPAACCGAGAEIESGQCNAQCACAGETGDPTSICGSCP